MRPCHFLLALLFGVFAASGDASAKFWTRHWVSALTLDLVDDSTMQEKLMFGRRFVAITRATLKRVVGDTSEWITTQPAYHWKLIDDRIVIYDPGSPRDSVETLSLVRREDSVLVLRRKSGAIARFRMSHN